MALVASKRNPDALVTLRASGLNETSIYLFATAPSRDRAFGKVESIRQSKLERNTKLPDFNYQVFPKYLRKVIAHFQSQSVVIEQLPAGKAAVRLVDEGEDYRAVTYLSALKHGRGNRIGHMRRVP